MTYKNIVDYSKIRETIYLPTHDENAGQRLSKKKVAANIRLAFCTAILRLVYSNYGNKI